ncbi:MAG: hypothetical protein ACRCXC_10750 [Legionella sp.]
MDQFHFVSGEELNDAQATDVAQLICYNGYYEFSSRDNVLNLPLLEFQKQQTLKPYAKYTHVLVRDEQVAVFSLWGQKSNF